MSDRQVAVLCELPASIIPGRLAKFVALAMQDNTHTHRGARQMSPGTAGAQRRVSTRKTNQGWLSSPVCQASCLVGNPLLCTV